MAEIKTGIFAKNVQKRLSRAQEKVLQKLGKADETKDEQFEQCVQNFKRQETEGSRLQREMKAYLAAVKAMQQASMNLTESLHEVYEPDWYGKDDVMTIGKSCDALWEDFHQRLVDTSLITLDTYLTQFPDIKNRVSKRSRKLIDFDSARHHLETLQASTMRNERKVSKAEEEFNKAQKVFDELNVDLQEELPSLWDSRVGFYVNTFKNVTHLEARFHKEISGVCHKLYEVMNQLGDQHSDKMFTIQGAPRMRGDSGPLRLARTPTPPDADSPPESPEASPNHMLAPGPQRPKSPSLLKKGPPVPPPPKVTPTKELHQEQIINLFGDSFAPEGGTMPTTQGEKVMDSLLDLDFDPFKPDATTPIGQTQSPMSQTLPWDLWTAPTSETAQPVTSDWAADFGAGPEAAPAGENGDFDAAGPAEDGGELATGQEEGQAWPPADGWGAEATQPLGETAVAEVSCWDPDKSPDPNPDSDPRGVGDGEAEPALEGEEPSRGDGREGGDQSMPGIVFTNEHGQEIQDATEGSEQGLYSTQGAAAGSEFDWGLSSQAGCDRSGLEYETADGWADGAGQNGGWVSAEEEPVSVDSVGVTMLGATEQLVVDGITEEPGGFADWGPGSQEAPFQTQVGMDEGSASKLSGTGRLQEMEPVIKHEQSSADPFGSVDAFSDPFAHSGGGGEPALEFVSDPFAEPPGPDGAGWATDPFASNGNQTWPEIWAPAAGSETWAFPGTLEGQPNGFAQWAAFPNPAPDGESGGASSDSPWQEVGGSSGFFSGDGRADIGQDPFTALPVPPGAKADARGSRVREATPGRKDNPENNNSDLSEDEVANRRYGNLYQEVDTEKEEVSNNAFNGVSQLDAGAPTRSVDSNQTLEEAVTVAETEADLKPVSETGEAQEPPAAVEAAEASPSVDKAAEVVEVPDPAVSPEAEPPEISLPAEAEKQSPGEAAPETAPTGEARVESPTSEAPAQTVDKESPKDQTLTVEPEGGEDIKPKVTEDAEAKEEKMPIPSVVIEPASSNEGDDDRDGDIISPTASSGNGITPEGQTEAPRMPPGFLYKVEALHDFEAANADELELKKGVVVLVIPTELVEDQDAGWLTGIKESDWLQQGSTAPKGLFPENFTQRLD